MQSDGMNLQPIDLSFKGTDIENCCTDDAKLIGTVISRIYDINTGKYLLIENMFTALNNKAENSVLEKVRFGGDKYTYIAGSGII